MNPKGKKVEKIAMRFANSRRDRYGLHPADTDTALVSAGREHARSMARNEYLAHEDPEGRMPTDRVRKYDVVSENCAKVNGWSSSTAGQLAADIIEQWMKSSSHRGNLLRKSMNKMGIGVWKSGDQLYAAQLMAEAKEDPTNNLFVKLFS